jgi:hypothetical protein
MRRSFVRLALVMIAALTVNAEVGFAGGKKGAKRGVR